MIKAVEGDVKHQIKQISTKFEQYVFVGTFFVLDLDIFLSYMYVTK